VTASARIRARRAAASASPPVPAEDVTAEQGAEGRRLGLGRVARGQREGDLPRLPGDQRADRRARAGAQDLPVEDGTGGRLAQADGGDQWRGHLPGRRDPGHLLGLARGAEGGEGLGELPAERRIHVLGARGGPGPVGSLDHSHDDRVGPGVAGGFLAGTQRRCHGSEPSACPVPACGSP
jgi:hypothetical protein